MFGEMKVDTKTSERGYHTQALQPGYVSDSTYKCMYLRLSIEQQRLNSSIMNYLGKVPGHIQNDTVKLLFNLCLISTNDHFGFTLIYMYKYTLQY